MNSTARVLKGARVVENEKLISIVAGPSAPSFITTRYRERIDTKSATVVARLCRDRRSDLLVKSRGGGGGGGIGVAKNGKNGRWKKKAATTLPPTGWKKESASIGIGRREMKGGRSS